MAATLHLVRHGRTVYNTDNLVQGWSDSPLTDEGVIGVRRTAQALAEVPFVAAYASPFGRTMATAREILVHHPDVPLTQDDGLREFHFGEWETLPEAELWAEYDPIAMFAGVFDGSFPGLPGGESSAAYRRRVADSFARIERAHTGDVLVVSHGVTLFAYLGALGEVSLAPLPNASVSTVRVNDDGSREVMDVGRDLGGHGLTPELAPNS